MKRSKAQIKRIEEILINHEKNREGKFPLFEMGEYTEKLTEQELEEKINELEIGINNTIRVINDTTNIDVLRDESVLNKILTQPNLWGEIPYITNLFNVKTFIKKAKAKSTKIINDAEIYIYNYAFQIPCAEQSKKDIIKCAIQYLEKKVDEENKEIKRIEKNIATFVKTLSPEIQEKIKKLKGRNK